MNAATILARESPRASAHRTAQAIARFAEPHRPAILRLASRHPRLADLAISFPALLFALAVPRRRFDTERAIARVIDGAPLAELAVMTSVPMWTRKLEPRVFHTPLPKLPDTPTFSRQIANHLPARNRHGVAWLDVIAETARLGHDDLAVWYARHYGRRDSTELVLRRWTIAAWAWHSRQEASPASRMVGVRWSPEISSGKAIDAAMRWRDGVSSLLHMDAHQVSDHWAASAVVDGFSFEPVRTAQDLVEAADAFNNCARDMGWQIVENLARVWVVRRDSKLVAMLQISNASRLYMSELSGLRSGRVSDEISLAAQNWFLQHCPAAVVRGKRQPYSNQAWRRMWKPYWLAMGRIPAGLPLTPTRESWEWFDPDPAATRHYRRLLRRRRLRL